MTTVYVLGTLYEAADSMAPTLLPQVTQLFPEYTFVHFDPTEGIPTDSPFVCIDTIAGIEKATLFQSLEPFAVPPAVTVHDYDLLQDLRIMRKLNRIQEFFIIGVPPHPYSTLIEDVQTLLARVLGDMGKTVISN